VNEAARRSGQTRFTALLHPVDVAALERAFRRQRRAASPGIDRVTVEDYERNLEANLQRLHARGPQRTALANLTSFLVPCFLFIHIVIFVRFAIGAEVLSSSAPWEGAQAAARG
jgi:hypothetical protein